MTRSLPDERPVLAVVGSTGFIGSAVARRAKSAGVWATRRLARGVGAGEFPPVDIRDLMAMRRALDGVSVTVHSASYLGEDPGLCHAINVVGTKNVVAAASRTGSRVIYISTAAVYGRGPFSMADESSLEYRPTSKRSASRAAAERIVLDAGGIVVRPHLILGAGDRWVGPGIIGLGMMIGGMPDGGFAKHSVIDVETLAASICALAGARRIGGEVFHAAQTEPVSVAELARMLRSAVPSLPSSNITAHEARVLVAGNAAMQGALALLRVDHVFASTRLARLTDAIRVPFQLDGRARRYYRDVTATVITR